MTGKRSLTPHPHRTFSARGHHHLPIGPDDRWVDRCGADQIVACAARAMHLALLTAQFLQRFCRWAVGIGAKDDHMLSTRMGNAEPVAMKVQLTDDRVAHMR